MMMEDNGDMALPDGPGPREPSPSVSALRASVPNAGARRWCLHDIGADEVHAAPDFETAQKWANWANERFHKHAEFTRFVVALWPWTAERHAETLAKSIAEWTLPESREESDDLLRQLVGRARHLRNRGEVKTPELLERAERALAAVYGWRECDWPEGFCRRTADLIADNVERVAAQGTSASGQDPQGLEAKPAGPVRQDAPHPNQDTHHE